MNTTERLAEVIEAIAAKTAAKDKRGLTALRAERDALRATLAR